MRTVETFLKYLLLITFLYLPFTWGCKMLSGSEMLARVVHISDAFILDSVTIGYAGMEFDNILIHGGLATSLGVRNENFTIFLITLNIATGTTDTLLSIFRKDGDYLNVYVSYRPPLVSIYFIPSSNNRGFTYNLETGQTIESAINDCFSHHIKETDLFYCNNAIYNPETKNKVPFPLDQPRIVYYNSDKQTALLRSNLVNGGSEHYLGTYNVENDLFQVQKIERLLGNIQVVDAWSTLLLNSIDSQKGYFVIDGDEIDTQLSQITEIDVELNRGERIEDLSKRYNLVIVGTGSDQKELKVRNMAGETLQEFTIVRGEITERQQIR